MQGEKHKTIYAFLNETHYYGRGLSHSSFLSLLGRRFALRCYGVPSVGL